MSSLDKTHGSRWIGEKFTALSKTPAWVVMKVWLFPSSDLFDVYLWLLFVPLPSIFYQKIFSFLDSTNWINNQSLNPLLHWWLTWHHVLLIIFDISLPWWMAVYQLLTWWCIYTWCIFLVIQIQSTTLNRTGIVTMAILEHSLFHHRCCSSLNFGNALL